MGVLIGLLPFILLPALRAVLSLRMAALAWRRPAFAERWNGVIIDGTVALYAFAGLAIGMPFSAEFARDTVAPALWTHPMFLQVTATITLVWGVAFVVLTVLAWPAP